MHKTRMAKRKCYTCVLILRPLHKAVFNNSVRILMVDLLIKNGADVNKTNAQGEIPLHYAIRLSREDLVTILLRAGSDITIRGKRENKTPYELALEEHHTKMAHLLKRAKGKNLSTILIVTELFDWIDALGGGIEQYKSKFIAEEIYVDKLAQIEDTTLDKLGITTTGHRLKLLKAVKLLKEQVKHETTPELKAMKSTGIESELEKLKYIHHDGTWNIPNGDLEFTVKLGSGTSGTVYKGLYKGQEVAIKVLKTEQSQKELDEFKKEFQIMRKVCKGN